MIAFLYESLPIVWGVTFGYVLGYLKGRNSDD